MRTRKKVVLNINIAPTIPESEHKNIHNILETFYKQYGHVVHQSGIEILPSTVVEINSACMWNEVRLIGCKGIVVASDDKVALVMMSSAQYRNGVYLHCDLAPLPSKDWKKMSKKDFDKQLY